MSAIRRIAAKRSADHIVLKITADDDINALGQTFTVAGDDGVRLRDVSQVQSVLTVIDGRNFQTNLHGEHGHSILNSISIASSIGVEGASTLSDKHHAEIDSIIQTVRPGAQVLRDDLVNSELKTLQQNEVPSAMQNEYCVPNPPSDAQS